MEPQTIALIAALVWLFGLTLVLLLVVRQLGLITLRLESGLAGSSVVPREGPDVGTELPATVLDRLPALRAGLNYLLLVSPTCVPCHELASTLESVSVTARVAALVPGAPELADPFVELLPSDYEIVRDPDASEVANWLDLDRTPFALEIEDGIVTGRAHLFTASDLQRLVDARATSNAAEIAKLAREGKSHAIA
jgi:hypothetical protein